MKKKIVIVVFAFVVMAAGIGIKSSVNSTNSSSLSMKDVEAISSCEVYVPIKGVIFECEGEKGSCEISYGGKKGHDITLTCSGKQVEQ